MKYLCKNEQLGAAIPFPGVCTKKIPEQLSKKRSIERFLAALFVTNTEKHWSVGEWWIKCGLFRMCNTVQQLKLKLHIYLIV